MMLSVLLSREKGMSYGITWLLAFSAGCSGVPVQEGELDIPALSALSWDSSVHTEDHVNIKTSTLTGSGKSSQASQEHHIGSFVDKEVLSPGLNEIVAHVGHSHAGGDKARFVLPDTGTMSHMDAAALSSKLVSITQSPLSSLGSTSAESTAVLPSSAESPAVLPSSAESPAVLPSSAESLAVLPSSAESSAVLPSSAQSLAVLPSSAESPAVLPSSAQSPAVLPSSAESPAVLPSSAESPAVLPSSAESPAVLPSSAESPAVLPSSAESPAVLPSSAKSPAVLPSSAESPAVLPSSAESPAVLPSSAESPAVLPSSAELAAVTIRAGESVEAAARLAGIDARDPPAPVDDEQFAPPAAPAEVSVPLGGATAVGRSRHRPEPGLAPAERKLSSRRNGVPELEMLENQSKPRKGVPPELGSTVTGTKPSSRRTGVPNLEMLENPSKPRKGAPPPPPSDGDTAAAGTDQAFLDAVYAGPEELAGEPTLDPSLASQRAVMSNLAKARAAVIVGVTFGVMSLLVFVWYGVRRVHDSWHHRHYRKMDFLVDGMYNL